VGKCGRRPYRKTGKTPSISNKKKSAPIYFDFRAVIANQYTKPGVKPTIKGIHTGHPSVTSDMVCTGNYVYLSLPAGKVLLYLQLSGHKHNKIQKLLPRLDQ
jgi:hypothetical protein